MRENPPTAMRRCRTVCIASLLLVLLGSAATYAAEPLIYRFEAAPEAEAELPELTLYPLEGGVFRLEGFPYPGEILYKKATSNQPAALAYRHPDEFNWLEIPLFVDVSASAHAIVKPTGGTPVVGGVHGKNWAVQVGGATCPNLTASAELGRKAGLTVRDIQGIFATMDALLSGVVMEVGCERYRISDAEAEQIGLPLRLESPFGPLRYTATAAEHRVNEAAFALDGAVRSWPTRTYPADAETRLRIVLHQFPLPLRVAFIREFAKLPTAEQVQMAAQTLQQLQKQ